MVDLIEAMVMEAGENRRARRNTGLTISDPGPDENENTIDYGGDVPDPEGGADNPPPDAQGAADAPEQGNDYGDGAPDPDEGEAPPPEPEQQGPQPQGDPNDPGGNPDAQQDPDQGNDYGAGAPDPDAEEGGEQPPQGPNTPSDQQGDPNDPNAATPQEGDPNQDPNAQPQDPNDPNAQQQGDTGGVEGTPDATAGDPSENEGMSQQEQTADSILLLRNFIQLHKEIRSWIKRIQESKRDSLLASATYDQVISNMLSLKDIVHKYILLVFDNSTYEENLYNFNYSIEVLHWNVEMLRKVNEAIAKAKRLKKNKKKSI